MCFSPEASFVGGIVISTIGMATLKKVHKPSQILFASIPMFFAVQQITEGFLWVALQHSDYGNAQQVMTQMYLIMARVLWPTLMPLSVLLMETNHKRKKILLTLLVMGVAVSLYYAFCLVSLNANAQIMGYHIHYETDFPKSVATAVFVIYFIAAVAPLFVSSIKRMRLLGVLMFLSSIITAIFFTEFLTSVWCFFAALISVVIFWILRDSKRNSLLPN